MPHTRLSLQEAADYLHLPVKELAKLVKGGDIPFEQSKDRPVFQRSAIDAWASTRLLASSENHLADFHRKSSAKMHDLSKSSAIIAELIRPGWILSDLHSKTKASVVRDMVDLADRTGLLNDKAELLKSVNAREKLCSTALNGGLAILHGQHHEPYMSDDSFVVLGRSANPLPFGSPDGQTTDLFFLMCCQDDQIHLHVLARICMLCQYTPLLMDLREADSAQAMYDAITRHEIELIRELQ